MKQYEITVRMALDLGREPTPEELREHALKTLQDWPSADCLTIKELV